MSSDSTVLVLLTVVKILSLWWQLGKCHQDTLALSEVLLHAAHLIQGWRGLCKREISRQY